MGLHVHCLSFMVGRRWWLVNSRWLLVESGLGVARDGYVIPVFCCRCKAEQEWGLWFSRFLDFSCVALEMTVVVRAAEALDTDPAGS
jgi:hypothetical protein